MTSTTVSPRWVTRLPPIRPGPRMPLKTRDGVAEAPIEPGARMLCEPCDFGPLVKLWRLIVPWKPLPFDLAGDLDLVARRRRPRPSRSRPTSSSPASSRNSTRWRWAEASAFLRWPSSGLVSAFSLHGAEGELHGLVAVALGGADRGHRARARPRARSRARRGRRRGRAASCRASWRGSRPSSVLGREADLDVDAGREVASRRSESTVFGVGWWMSISRLCVRISKCSRESLSLNGERITQ